MPFFVTSEKLCDGAVEKGDQDGRQQVGYLDVFIQHHVDADSHDQQATYSAHLRNDNVAQQWSNGVAQQCDRALIDENRYGG